MPNTKVISNKFPKVTRTKLYSLAHRLSQTKYVNYKNIRVRRQGKKLRNKGWASHENISENIATDATCSSSTITDMGYFCLGASFSF